VRWLREAFEVLALTVEPLTPRPELRTRVCASLDPDRRFEALRPRLAQLLDLADADAARLLGAWEGSGEGWVQALPGVRFYPFAGGPRVAASTCRLVEVQPGAGLPRHEHAADEWWLVLQGMAEEDSGQIFQVGDLLHRGAGSAHSFRALGSEPYRFAIVLGGRL
jgi:quercetin dioxygenase-like cupin family protein